MNRLEGCEYCVPIDGHNYTQWANSSIMRRICVTCGKELGNHINGHPHPLLRREECLGFKDVNLDQVVL